MISMRNKILTVKVRYYFYELLSDAAFLRLMASNYNEDSVTGNRMFDRARAVDMIKARASVVDDHFTMDTREWDIYRCLIRIARYEGFITKVKHTAGPNPGVFV